MSEAELIELLEGLLNELEEQARSFVGEYSSLPYHFEIDVAQGNFPYAEQAIELLKKLKGEI